MNTIIVANCVATITLICALLGTGSSQQVLDNSRATTNRVECNENQFGCRNGECIPSELLCDGRADCSDQSDETQGECTKPELTCPDYAFRCTYGACVNGDATCNGVKDCIDNSDELLPRCPGVSGNVLESNCGENDYSCKNGQCISSTSLCDGQIDCNDGSDETSTACGSFQCSQLVFRCKYGACIDGDLPCNGRRDCADGSDEDPLLCGGAVPTQTPTPTPIPTPRPTSRPTPTPYPTPVPTPSKPLSWECLVPRQPKNGQWKLHRYLCEGGVHCDIPQGVSLEPGSQLVYTCSAGYKIRGNMDVFCGPRGNWSAIPVCVEIRCPPLNSASTTTSCTRLGEWTSCDSSVLPKTRAEVSCRVGYRKDTSSIITRRELVECNNFGRWDPDPIKCVPVCGVATTKQTPFIFNGTTANIADFPWHATLYKETKIRNVSTKEFTCGATVIHTKILLTAAHCIYDERTKMTEDPNKYYIVTGNIFRDYDSPLHNPDLVRKGKVKNIYRNCRYYGLEGNYATDIALLELEEELRFSGILLPACLDVSGFSEQILEPGVVGRVAGFGRTETATSSAILQTINVPYISYSQCKSSNNGAENEVFIGTDKFCAGFTNGSAVCEGDSGGGLVFKKNDLWYVMGIVSVGLGVNTQDGERTCDRFSYSLYTKVANYMGWIQDVMFQLERFNSVQNCGQSV